jgi:hypothetical protein
MWQSIDGLLNNIILVFSHYLFLLAFYSHTLDYPNFFPLILLRPMTPLA